MVAHLPDPLPFGVAAALVGVAAIITWARSRDVGHVLFGGLLLVVAFQIADFALFLIGVGLPEVVWRPAAVLVVVLPVLLVLHHPHRRVFLSDARWSYGVAALATVVLSLTGHFLVFGSAMAVVFHSVLAVVLPGVGAAFILDAGRARSARGAWGRVALGLGLFVLAVPEAVTMGLDSYERLVVSSGGSLLWRLNLGPVVAGGVAALLVIGVAVASAVIAMRGGSAGRPLWLGACASIFIVASPLVLFEMRSSWMFDHGPFVLPVVFAVVGVTGLFLSAGERPPSAGPFGVRTPATDAGGRPGPEEDV